MGLKARCLNCGDVIESKLRHDFKQCSCESCFVDGGNDYGRLGYADPAKVEVYNAVQGLWVNQAILLQDWHDDQNEPEKESEPEEQPSTLPTEEAPYDIVKEVINNLFFEHEELTTLQIKEHLRDMGFMACQDTVSSQFNKFYEEFKDEMGVYYKENSNGDSYKVYYFLDLDSDEFENEDVVYQYTEDGDLQ